MARIAEVLLHDGSTTAYGVADTFEFVPAEYHDEWTKLDKGDGTSVFFAPHAVTRVNVYDVLAA